VEVPVAGTGRGRDFGRLVHAILERAAIDRPEDLAGIATALAPRYGLGDDAAFEAAADANRTLGMPVLARARAAASVFRELRLWFPDDGRLVEGVIDLVFEEEGGLVLVDYKTHPVSEGELLAQAERHKTQLQLYGRGLAQATGLRVRERLVLFTALGRAVPV
jgi:ATP-dependent helicase/nuclease subunit A